MAAGGLPVSIPPGFLLINPPFFSELYAHSPFCHSLVVIHGQPLFIHRSNFVLDRKTVRILGVSKYARAVKQKVWNETENGERDWGETPFCHPFPER